MTNKKQKDKSIHEEEGGFRPTKVRGLSFRHVREKVSVRVINGNESG